MVRGVIESPESKLYGELVYKVCWQVSLSLLELSQKPMGFWVPCLANSKWEQKPLVLGSLRFSTGPSSPSQNPIQL